MSRFLRGRFLIFILLFIFISGAVILYMQVLQNKDDIAVTAQVERGSVRQLVSVSGSLKAENTAELGFPVGGTVALVHVRKGDVVEVGAPLVTLESNSLRASVAEAEADLASVKAERAELIAGATISTRTVSSENTELRSAALLRAKADEALKIKNARSVLLSENIKAYSDEASETAIPPIITGSYRCDREGIYTIEVYSSAAASGYSLRLSGLEFGTFELSTDQDIPFGACGLRARFFTNTNYHNSKWYVSIPNTASTNYVVNKNAYDLAVSNAQSTISSAESALTLAQAETAVVVAPTRSETIARATAKVAQTEARLLRARATFDDSTMYAPFTGTVVDVAIVQGESVTTLPVVTLVSPDRFELIARVPEIDIGKLKIGQKAEVIFDTAANDTLSGTIDYIAPSAMLIDGVAYYEARLLLSSYPQWLRSGLNADVDIVVAEAAGLRLPKRFITEREGEFSVLIPTPSNSPASTSIEVILSGNDGYTAITGLPMGTTVVAPQ